MIRNFFFSIVSGIFIWILGVSFYLLSFSIPIIENTELQSNILLALGIIPSAFIGTYFFYSKSYIKPYALALKFVILAVLLDALITVPVFIIPNGGNYSEFFENPMFYAIAVEIYCIVFYFGNYLTNSKIQA